MHRIVIGLLVASGLLSLPLPAMASTVHVDWLTTYPNESLQVAHLASNPRMLRNISNSTMIVAPNYLEGATYLQRRTSASSGYEGIAELSQDWLRPDRVTLSAPAVVIVAIREPFYPGAGELLMSQGWTTLDNKITLSYYQDLTHLTLYMGLVNAGPVEISGAGVQGLLDKSVANSSTHHYFFFQDRSAFSPEVLAQFHLVSVPEPSSLVLLGLGTFSILGIVRYRTRIRRVSSR